MRLKHLALGVALAALPSALAAQGPKEEVLSALNGFLAALKAKDSTTMLQYVDSLTRMTLIRPTPTGGSRIAVLNGRQFIGVATAPNQPPLDEPIRNPVVQVDGELATVWAEYQVIINGAVSHCGFDAFQFTKVSGQWKLLSVADTFRRQGCGERWPR